jgi:hypothetical protein
LEAPYSEIEASAVEYPYLPIREVRSEDLSGETIRSLHDWVHGELEKLNQDMKLDIIVDKYIIDNMDCPIEVVYQHLAENKARKQVGDKEYEFFKVVYRIQGILGEPKQRGPGNLRDTKLETCISLASHFLKRFSEEFEGRIGLDVLIAMLEKVGPASQDKKVLLFEILYALSMSEAICRKIVEGQYGDSIINATVRLMSFENEKNAKITNLLLELSSKVIDEANIEMINLRKGELRKISGVIGVETSSGGMESEQLTLSESEGKVGYVLGKIADC